MKRTITHTTSYIYDAPVSYGLQQVRLCPVNTTQQKVIDWSVDVEGGKKELSFTDHHQNHTILLQSDPGQQEVKVTARGVVETLDDMGVLGRAHGTAPLWYFQQHTPRTQPGKEIRKLAKPLRGSDDVLGDLHRLSSAILAMVPYKIGETEAWTTAEDALNAQAGVCQDHAQIFIAVAREAGVPARYVSGYLMMNDRIEQDATHAWAEAHVDGLGWVGFDVSNGISPDARYVRIATGRDSRDAAPITGVRLGRAQESMIVALQVQQ